MAARHVISNPSLSVKGFYRRQAWAVRSLIAFYPRLFFPLMRFKARERSSIIREDTKFD